MSSTSEKTISSKELYNKMIKDRKVLPINNTNANVNAGDYTKFLVIQEGLLISYVATALTTPDMIEIVKAPGINSFTISVSGVNGTVIGATKVEGTTKSLVTDTSWVVDDNGAGVRLIIDRTTTIPTITLTLL